MRTVLILGGTAEARALAAEVVTGGDMRVISSLAGRVRDPALPAGEHVIGGFGGVTGLAAFIQSERVTQVVDATHPYAVTITAHAVQACERVNVPLLILQRPPWSPASGDQWTLVPSLEDAAAHIRAQTGPAACIFLTTGRRDLAPFRDDHDRTYLIRAVDPPEVDLPPRHVVVLDRGPFTVDGEVALMRAHRVSALVTKNSGGSLTQAKLEAARLCGIPVIMIDRPATDSAANSMVTSVADALAWIRAR